MTMRTIPICIVKIVKLSTKTGLFLLLGDAPKICQNFILPLILPNVSNHLELLIILYPDSFNKKN